MGLGGAQDQLADVCVVMTSDAPSSMVLCLARCVVARHTSLRVVSCFLYRISSSLRYVYQSMLR